MHALETDQGHLKILYVVKHLRLLVLALVHVKRQRQDVKLSSDPSYIQAMADLLAWPSPDSPDQVNPRRGLDPGRARFKCVLGH